MGVSSPMRAATPLGRWPWVISESRLSKPVSSVPPCSAQFLPSGSCLCSCPYFLHNGLSSRWQSKPLLLKLLGQSVCPSNSIRPSSLSDRALVTLTTFCWCFENLTLLYLFFPNKRNFPSMYLNFPSLGYQALS